MSAKKMLYVLSRVNMALNQPTPPSGQELQELREMVADALSQGAQTLQRMGRPRNPSSAAPASGRRPSARYCIDVDNHAPQIAVGGLAAAELVNAHLAAFGMKQRVTMNTLVAGISRSGAWVKLCDHANGTSAITVTRAPDGKSA